MSRWPFVILVAIAVMEAAMAALNFAGVFGSGSLILGAWWCSLTLFSAGLLIDLRRRRIRGEAREAEQAELRRAYNTINVSFTTSLNELELQRRDERRRELQQEHEKAQNRSLALLMSYLTPAQQREWASYSGVPYRNFTVKGKDSRLYRLIERVNGCVIDETGQPWCIAQVARDYGPIPFYDTLLAAKLLLETNPKLFFEIAMRHGGPESWAIRRA